jgi:hypothetical protein
MKEIFLLTDKTNSDGLQEVIVLLVEYNSYLNFKNENVRLQFQANKLKDLGYFAKVSKIHNQYKDIPVRLGTLEISNLDLKLFILEEHLKLIDTLGKASFTENSAEITSSAYLTLIDTHDYVPINIKVGVLMTMNTYIDSEDNINNQLLSDFIH